MHFEITVGPEYDLCNVKMKHLIRGWISSHCVAGVWIATPCTSWSRARRGPMSSSWGPIRSNQFIYGFPNVSGNDQDKLRQGNATMRSTVQIIRACISHQVPAFFENPCHSMIWSAPELKRSVSITLMLSM